MTTEVITQPAMTISKLIEINIPTTHDTGDALSVAVRILDAAYGAMARENMMQDYRLIAFRARNYIAAQHVAWMKGA